jgi:predicted GNAT superfamily acetyltransferase
METHAHHLHKVPGKKWTHYLFEFLMLFLAVFTGFLAENFREHIVERTRAHQFLQSMLLDVKTNITNLDSLIKEDHEIIANHDSLANWLLADSATIDRAAFSKQMGAVWIRNFLVRKETYEQMKSSGSLRYVGDIEFLKKMMDYERVTNFAQHRNQEFERKYYTELFIPAVYKAYDLTCQINLDTSNHSDIFKMEKLSHHHDVLSGNDATVFRHDMGAALTLRLERLRRSMDAYRDAKVACVEMEGLIKNQLRETGSDK